MLNSPMSSPHGKPQPNQPHRLVVAAAVTLLGSGRLEAVQSARERLLRWCGTAGAPVVVEALQAAAEANSVPLRLRARALLRSLEIRNSVQRLSDLRLGRTGRSHAHTLLEGAVLVTQLVRGLVPDAEELGCQLRALGAPLRKLVATRSLPYVARCLADRLHSEFGLVGARLHGPCGEDASGDAANGDPADSVRPDAWPVGDAAATEPAAAPATVLLDQVMKYKAGGAVSLSLLYLLVARWAGLSASGVALPGHFLIRLHGPRPLLLDPYHGGRSVTKLDCQRYLRAAGYRQFDSYLRDLTDAEMLLHYLRAVKAATASRATAEAKLAIERALLVLETG